MSHALGLLRRAIQLVLIAMFTVLIATVFYQVVGRYLLNAPPSWSEELARFLQVWIALLASALCIQQAMHLAVDYRLYAVPPRARPRLLALVAGAHGVFPRLAPFPVVAVLLFMVAGSNMEEGGLARGILDFASALVGRFRAGLAMIAVGATMLISGVSGSGTADTAAVGS